MLRKWSLILVWALLSHAATLEVRLPKRASHSLLGSPAIGVNGQRCDRELLLSMHGKTSSTVLFLSCLQCLKRRLPGEQKPNTSSHFVVALCPEPSRTIACVGGASPFLLRRGVGKKKPAKSSCGKLLLRADRRMLVPSWPLGGGFKDRPSAKLFCFLGTSEASAVSSQLAEVLPETGKDSGKARCRIVAQRDLQGEGLDVSQKEIEAAKNIDRRH